MKIQIHQNHPIYFTSDLHFSHRSILKYTKRPFQSIEEMNEGLIERWNNKVPKNSTVICCGDFSFDSKENSESIFKRLNGVKYLVIGNHDKFISETNWKKVEDVLEFNYKGLQFFCSHYAHRVWNCSHHGSIHLYGHSHNSLPDDINSKSMDCGIDCHPNFEPFSLEEVLERMKSKTFIPIDHHKKKEI